MFEQVGDAHLFHGSSAVAVSERQLALFANVLLEGFFSVAVRHGDDDDETMALIRYCTVLFMTAIESVAMVNNGTFLQSRVPHERSAARKDREDL